MSVWIFFQKIWPTWGNLICVVFGALLSCIISYYLTNRRENKKVKVDLQIKAAQEYSEVFDDFRNSNFFFDCRLQLFFYNTELQSRLKLLEQYGPELQIDGVLNIQSKAVFEKTAEINNKIYKYHHSLLAIIILLETKEVIFNRFVGIRDELLASHDTIYDISNQILHVMQHDVADKVQNDLPIDDDIIDLVAKLEQEVIKKKVDLDCILCDISVELQNEFLGKLFHYKVPIRVPKDKNIPVYRAGYKFKKKPDNKTKAPS